MTKKNRFINKGMVSLLVATAFIASISLAACAPNTSAQTTTSPQATPSSPSSTTSQSTTAPQATTPQVTPLQVTSAQQSTAASGSQQLQKVTLRLSWTWKTEFAPIVLTLDKGYFQDEGLDVQLLQTNGSGAVLPLVANGQADFGYVSMTTAAIGISKDLPIKVVAGILNKDPSALAFFASQNIKAPKDLEGKSLALTPGEAFTEIWPSFASKWGIDTSKVKVVQMNANAKLQAFLNGQVDVIPVFTNNELPTLRSETTKQIDVMSVADYGFNTLSEGIIASNSTIQNNPDLVKRFITALQMGYVYSLDHPDEALADISKVSPELASQPHTVLLQGLQATLDLLHSPNTQTKPIGWMSPDDWQTTINILDTTGGISKQLPPTDFYTDNFVPTSTQ
jgi:NitT/TauT family transport system substrate-binding protein